MKKKEGFLIVFFLVFFYNKIVIKRTNKIVNYIITFFLSITFIDNMQIDKFKIVHLVEFVKFC